MDIHFRNKLTEDDLHSGFRILYPRVQFTGSFWLMQFAIPVVAVALAYLQWGIGIGLEFYVLAFLLAVVCPAVTVYYYKCHHLENVARKFAKQSAASQEEADVFLNAESGVLVRYPSAEMTWTWQQIALAREAAEYFVLASDPACIIIPKRCLSDQQETELRSFLTRAGKMNDALPNALVHK